MGLLRPLGALEGPQGPFKALEGRLVPSGLPSGSAIKGPPTQSCTGVLDHTCLGVVATKSRGRCCAIWLFLICFFIIYEAKKGWVGIQKFCEYQWL